MKNKNNAYRVFQRSGCLTAEGVRYYCTGKLPEHDMVRVGEHISECELCREAVQGAGYFSDPNRYVEGIDILKEKWNRRTYIEKKISSAAMAGILSAAASFLVVVGIHLIVRYQKAERREYIASVYRQGMDIDNALASSEVFRMPLSAGKQADIVVYETKAREKYRLHAEDIKGETIPLAIMDETRIVAGMEKSGDREKEHSTSPAVETKSGILRYPYRVMSMPPPEYTAADAASTYNELYFMVEEMPRFQGKEIQQFNRYVQQNIRYPARAAELNISGRVYVQFTVNENGRLAHAKIIKSLHPLLDAEVLRVINNSPEWQPGKQKGKPLKVTMVMPVSFYLY